MRSRCYGKGSASRQSQDTPLPSTHARTIRRAQYLFSTRHRAEHRRSLRLRPIHRSHLLQPHRRRSRLRRSAPPSFALIPQRGDTFGERLFAATEDLLACGYGSICLIDSDSPTVPAAAFHQAAAELARPGDRIVLGPSSDGGYYLIGLKHPHSEPFSNIHWSTSTVYAETIAAASAANIETVTLPLWYDVDDAATLALLSAELLTDTSPSFATLPGYPAPHTRLFLQNLNRANP